MREAIQSSIFEREIQPTSMRVVKDMEVVVRGEIFGPRHIVSQVLLIMYGSLLSVMEGHPEDLS
jgi:hypothetical protein